mmetsp:Transcript_118215/g.280654  ORF Transcript_118215/g.280654 Transcript_118215/m.280654 type:complete len:218 (+) Transcript_118215:4321-4974(+)
MDQSTRIAWSSANANHDGCTGALQGQVRLVFAGWIILGRVVGSAQKLAGEGLACGHRRSLRASLHGASDVCIRLDMLSVHRNRRPAKEAVDITKLKGTHSRGAWGDFEDHCGRARLGWGEVAHRQQIAQLILNPNGFNVVDEFGIVLHWMDSIRCHPGCCSLPHDYFAHSAIEHNVGAVFLACGSFGIWQLKIEHSLNATKLGLVASAIQRSSHGTG